MNDFITVTRFDTSSKSSSSIGNHITVQNGTPNFTSLSPFKYKEFSPRAYNAAYNEIKYSIKNFPNKKNQLDGKKNIDDLSIHNRKLHTTLNENDLTTNNSENETHVMVPNLYESKQNNTNSLNNQPIKKRKVKSSLRKELKYQIKKVTTPTRQRRSDQTEFSKPVYSIDGQIEGNHVVNTFKNVSKSKSKVFDNAQRIRYEKAIQDFGRIENYKDKMIEFESEKITARFSPTRNTDFNSSQSANPILTSSQLSQKQIKYYFCPSHISNTSKIKGFNGSVNYDRGITEAVADVRRDRLKTDFLFQY